MPQVYLITGASTGFGSLAARALAKAGYIVYAGLYSHSGDTKQSEEEAAAFAQANNVDLRTVPLDLLNQDSVNDAVQHILSSTGAQLDIVIHNAGHMNFGWAESFTPEQYLRLYDVNVVGCQRLNMAILPHMRAKRSGHLIWISSSTVYGAKPPLLGGYFAAKAAMDSLAQIYARELNPWGIETTILMPGVFPTGTNHFVDAMRPGVLEINTIYDEGPAKGTSEQFVKGMNSLGAAGGADPTLVADALVDIAAAPRGLKPYRVVVDPAEEGAKEAAAVADKFGADSLRRIGMENLLKVSL